MIRPKGLGRGLDALLSASDDGGSSESLQTLAIDRIDPGKYQPRTRMDETALAELAASIREQGVMQPILVRPAAAGRFEIIAGERRWRAAQQAGLTRIPALVKPVTDQVALALALIENLQREDLNPFEEAQGLARLIDEFGMTHDAAAKAVGRSRSAVTNLLRLRELAKPVQELLQNGSLDMGHARALLGLSGAQQIGAASRVVARGLSVRETEQLVHAIANAGKQRAGRAARARDPDLARLETELSDSLGAPVSIESRRKGSGRLTIAWSSLDELDAIIARLRGAGS